MKKLSLFYFFFFSFFWIISYFSYPFCHLLELEERVVNLLLYSTLLFINICFLIIYVSNFGFNVKLFSRLYIYAILIVVMQLFFSILFNTIDEWLPTLIRYCLYLSTFAIFYIVFYKNMININLLSITITILTLILILSSLVEIMSGNVQFLNGAYRVSGNFRGHHLAFALSCFVNINYLLHVNFKQFNLIRIILLILLFVAFFMSHSRLLLISLFISNLSVIYLLKKQIFMKFLYLISSIFLLFSLFLLVLYTDLMPRISELFFSNKIDSSTLYRIFIVNESLNNLSFSQYFTGIGLGGFNEFFFLATNERDVAAHNDYLLMLVEGGIVSLILYVYIQYKVVIDILKTKNSKSNIAKLVFVLFFGIEILGFLENAHYFYQSEILIFIILAYFYASEKKGFILSSK